MKKSFAFCTIIVCILLGASCQKEIVWESIGTLVKKAGGECDAVVLHGTYALHTKLNSSHSMMVSVNVTLPGTYHIFTDTVNGYWFSATGTFDAKGQTRVSLAGSGVPDTAGTSYFSIFYGESTCEAAVTIKGDIAATDTIKPVAYRFTDGSGQCLADTVHGSYITGVFPDTSAYILAGVYVSSPGRYTIITDTVNGYHFSAIGQFTDTGVQSVKLLVSGKPVKEGTDNFSLRSSGGSVCNFEVPVLSPVVVTGVDLLPLSQGNYWVYYDRRNHDRLVTRTVTGMQIVNGNPYYVVDEQNRVNAQYLLRKNKTITETTYDEYTRIDKYTTSFQYKKVIDTPLIFLREDMAANSAWESDEIRDTADFGQVIFLKYYFQCARANWATVVNGRAFSHVYEIHVQPLIKSEFADYGPAEPTYVLYYAQGVGLIYMLSYTGGILYSDMEIKDWHVN